VQMLSRVCNQPQRLFSVFKTINNLIIRQVNGFLGRGEGILVPSGALAWRGELRLERRYFLLRKNFPLSRYPQRRALHFVLN
jgi:hypothetical protein